MGIRAKNQTIGELEKALCKINGIKAAQIVGNGKGVEEIHIISTSRKNGSNLSNEVESFLINEFGISIDPEKINVVKATTKKIINPYNHNLKLKSVIIDNHMFSTIVRVSLSSNGNIYKGLAKGSSAKKNKANIVAEATLDALEQAHKNITFSLDSLKKVEIGSQNMLCTNISVTQENIIGNVLKDDDQEDEATVNAILDAIDKYSNLL